MATLTKVADAPEVDPAFPTLRKAILTMAGVQVRNQATIGGHFCRAVPCTDTPPICITGGAELRLKSACGERTLRAEDFRRDGSSPTG